MAVQGSLRELSVLEALQMIGSQRKTATLELESPEGKVQLHFRDGLLVASHRRDAAEGDAFLDSLVALGHLSPTEAVRIAHDVRQGRDLWTLAREIDYLDEGTLREVYGRATEATLDRVLLWERGHFAILSAAPVEPVLRPGLGSDSILLDSMRRLDELAAWRSGPLPPDAVPCVCGREDEFVGEDRLRRAVLRQIDGRRTIEQIGEATRLGAYDVYGTIAEGLQASCLLLLDLRTGVREPAPESVAHREVHRPRALVVLSLLLAVGLGGAWVGQERGDEDRPWQRARRSWEEIDLRRTIEVYRHRHGEYPAALASLEAERLLPHDAAARWLYRPEGSAYRLSPR
ncbi:MAG: DUF4388 domain-containing protein [Candidatus Eisenbacteria bacterium]